MGNDKDVAPVRVRGHDGSVIFQAAYTSDTIRAFDTAKLMLKENNQPTTEIYQDGRLREWCLGTMEAEKNKVFIEHKLTSP